MSDEKFTKFILGTFFIGISIYVLSKAMKFLTFDEPVQKQISNKLTPLEKLRNARQG